MNIPDEITNFRGKHKFLSNFYSPCPVTYEGMTFPSTEHAYQAAKFTDKKLRVQLLKENKPVDVKRLARKLEREGNRRDDWNDIKIDVMEGLVMQKFTRYNDLKTSLINTGNARLVEGNTWHDNIWGVCSCPKCVGITGQNHLGKVLMRVRKEVIRLTLKELVGSSKETTPEERAEREKELETMSHDELMKKFGID